MFDMGLGAMAWRMALPTVIKWGVILCVAGGLGGYSWILSGQNDRLRDRITVIEDELRGCRDVINQLSESDDFGRAYLRDQIEGLKRYYESMPKYPRDPGGDNETPKPQGGLVPDDSINSLPFRVPMVVDKTTGTGPENSTDIAPRGQDPGPVTSASRGDRPDEVSAVRARRAENYCRETWRILFQRGQLRLVDLAR